MVFNILPTELVLLIGDHLPARDLHSLTLVNRYLSTLFSPYLHALAVNPSHVLLALYWAVLSNDEPLIQRIRSHGPRIFVPRPYSVSLTSDIASLRQMIFRGGVFKLKKPRKGRCPRLSVLEWATRNSHHTLLKLALDKYAWPGNLGLGRALQAAVELGDEKAAHLLLNHGANPDLISYLSPLGTAAEGGHLGVAKLLLKYGLGHHSRDMWNSAYVKIAEANGHQELVQLLLQHTLCSRASSPCEGRATDIPGESETAGILHAVDYDYPWPSIPPYYLPASPKRFFSPLVTTSTPETSTPPSSLTASSTPSSTPISALCPPSQPTPMPPPSEPSYAFTQQVLSNGSTTAVTSPVTCQSPA